MKQKKATYLSLFLLFCFIGAFSINAYANIDNFASRVAHVKNTISSTDKTPQNDNNGFTFTKTESESENNFSVAEVVLLFTISFQLLLLSRKSTFTVNRVVENPSQPIYLSVCNFRI